ncbi:NADH-quinone oxidoreductase subunit A [Thermosulfidibacter takaii ABI70S6]|uniref:NADH-quinone oxidoreductase subunit A n=1 Tax=Thermosulfidibacter takaii (strain DSM 17441 / JCM 13301 / NBRC 103674 / ABI70S6) TaxID=1298851 RepID=A0A0S3QVD4_THET7|nr:NADH-quinone oxidoreductase subunit A [Thermosulfidibacter takaii]BAT72298.1 NADH-quinone oxidoreductase subunit A [Thermosulfidibacter takaii ABI70S6]
MYQHISPYVPVLILFVLAVAFGIVTLIVAWFVRPDKPYDEKLSPYECGINPLMPAKVRVPIRFFVIILLFLLFDVEAVFMYPWAVMYKKLGVWGFIEMFLFIVILLIGYIYAWAKGALEWE